MADVVRLRWGGPSPAGDYLVISQVGRIRGFDYYVAASPSVAGRVGQRPTLEGPGYASLDTALREAQSLAAKHGLCAIYVEAGVMLGSPIQSGSMPPFS